MLRMIRARREAKSEQDELDRAAPKAGDMAPAFELRDADGADPVRLSDFRGKKPVALIFGSYT
ncbi:MAG: redoxin domain-containing protein [Anaerolineales bacterium]|nr:MAG: redoxin domain-containing protein [Anaerolineales bacterium]